MLCLIVPARVACKLALFGYTGTVLKTMGTGIGVPNIRGGQPPYAAFFSSVLPSCARFQRAGLGGGAFGLTGSHGCRHANPTSCPPTPIGVGRRAFTHIRGGRNA